MKFYEKNTSYAIKNQSKHCLFILDQNNPPEYHLRFFLKILVWQLQMYHSWSSCVDYRLTRTCQQLHYHYSATIWSVHSPQLPQGLHTFFVVDYSDVVLYALCALTLINQFGFATHTPLVGNDHIITNY